MKQLSFLLFLTAISFQSYSQVQITSGAVFDPQFGIIKEYSTPKSNTKETIYLTERWRKGTVYLSDSQQIRNYEINYDVMYNMVEVLTKDGIKVIQGNKVNKVVLANKAGIDSTVLLNCNIFRYNNTQHYGFYEVISTGSEIQLFKITYIETIKSNYNAALDVGSKTNKTFKKERYYLASGKSVSVLNKDNLFSLFGSKRSILESYAKENRLKGNKYKDASKLISYYSSL